MLVTFLYTSPTYGVSGPKIIPSNKEAVTKGISSFVILLRKVVILDSVIFKFIFI
jgi:hypothetical protein